MQIGYTLIPEWPPLAWLARCWPGQEVVEVFHGPRVEVGPESFTEAVWAGLYTEAGFDRTDLVFGTGGRLREGTLTFVSSGTTMKSDKKLGHQRPANIDRASQTLPSCFTADDGSLVISFDHGWYPFLCDTGGSNKGSQRWYIPKLSRLIAQVARALQMPMQTAISYVPGGRIFLDAAGVRRKPEGHAEIPVLGWSLPRESPLLPPR